MNQYTFLHTFLTSTGLVAQRSTADLRSTIDKTMRGFKSRRVHVDKKLLLFVTCDYFIRS